MTSAIDPTVIADGVNVSKAVLRTQLATARDEITALQNAQRSVYDIRSVALMDGSDQTANLQTLADTVEAAGGGTIFQPIGTVVGTIKLGANTTYMGEGQGSIIKAPLGTTNAVIESKNYRALMDLRVQSATAIASGTTAIPVPATVPPCANGDTIYIPIRATGGGAFQGYHVTTLASFSSGTWNLAAAIPGGSEVEPYAIIFNGSKHGPENVTVRDVTVDGNSASGTPNNICLSQSMTGGTPLSLNGAGILGSAARSAWATNSSIIINTSATNAGRTLAIVGTRRNKDLSVSAQSETLAIDALGLVATAKRYETITSITPSGVGALSDTITVGFGDGANSRSGIAMFGLRPGMRNVYVRHCRGWGIDLNWIVPVAGFNSTFADQQPMLSMIDVDRCDAGGMRLNGPVDAGASHVYVNYPLGPAIYFTPIGAGTIIAGGHVNGGNIGGGVLREPYDAIVVEGEGSGVTDQFKVEGFKRSGFLARANNAIASNSKVFNINTVTQVVGVKIGDNAEGWGSNAGYDISMKIERCGIGVEFDSDGGLGKLHMNGWMNQLTVTSNSTGATLNCTSIQSFIATNSVIAVQLDSGSTHVATITGFPTANSATLSPVLPSQASTGRGIFLGRLYTGTPATGLGSSDHRIKIRGAHPESYQNF